MHKFTAPSALINRQILITVSAGLLSLFVFYTSFFGSFETLVQRSLFVSAVTLLGILMFPSKWGKLGLFLDLLGLGAVITTTIYVIVQFEAIMTDLPLASNVDKLMMLSTLAMLLVLARRISSAIFPIIVLSSVLYASFGDLIPGSFGHKGFDLGYITEVLLLSDKGFWGMLVGVASTTLAAFVLFGALLLHTGAGEAFFQLSSKLASRSQGGAAKVATLASAFFGTISGSTVANVATTGNFTIPLMKRLGYPPAFAGGVEAVASTGGQLMPPIMGTAAFVMAELLGANYWTIVVAATLPAIAFYVGILVSVHIASGRLGITESVEDIEQSVAPQKLGLLEFTPIIAGFAGIIFGVFNGNSIDFTACLGMIGIIGAFIVVSLFKRLSFFDITKKLVDALIDGGKGVVTVGILLIAAQVFVAMLNLTGLGVNVSNFVLNLAGGNLYVVVTAMALICLVAGMGLPTSAAYVLVAAVFAPALISKEFDPLAVHLFVLYFACLSVITPPVCVGSFVAAAIAKCSWLSLSGWAMRLGAGCYFVPFLFFAYPGLLLNGSAFDILNGIMAALVIAFAVPKLLIDLPTGVDRSLLVWLIALAAILTLFETHVWGSTAGVVLTFLAYYFTKRRGPTKSNLKATT
jgi:TRAP transporter 4TM/12TM fusion protein